MPDLLEQSSAWLEDQRTKHLSHTVTYRRGDQSAEVAATIGRTVFRVDDQYGAQIRSESRDYLVLTADLVLVGNAALPQRGDQIRETVGETVFVYEVIAPGDEPCFRFSDPYRKTLRIHTKQIDQEGA